MNRNLLIRVASLSLGLVLVIGVRTIGHADDQRQVADQPVDADFLLQGGLLYLGDGAKPQPGDVAIVGDQIVAVGQFPIGQVKVRVPCEGLSISPGFIAF